MGPGRRLLVVVMLTLISFVQAGCGGSHPAPVKRGVVFATPGVGVFDEPVHIAVSHVAADRKLTVRLQSVDATGAVFAAQATFRSNGAGQLDLASAPAVDGAYQGVDPMGLIDAMQPVSGGTNPYHWKGAQPQRFDVNVSEGASRVASGGFTRRGSASGVTMREESIGAIGFYGQFWAPPAGRPRRPAVLEFGGSEGGVFATGKLIGAALASAGYPTLDLAYFGEPGLPATLREIPLEYFARALRWLDRRPEALKGQTYVLGGSRGSEAALLLGAHYPTLVHGVIASSPSDVSFGSYPGRGSAAWTLHGRPVPYTSGVSPNVPAYDPAATIPVQDIRGPVFLDCGTDDQVWTSCAYALRIENHLAAARFAYPHVLYRYEGAGHFVNLLVPYQPGEILSDLAQPAGQGNTLLANANAHARLWPQLLSFLAHPHGTGVVTERATPPPLTPG